MIDQLSCEKCGTSMKKTIDGSCINVVCPNCGWGWATTYTSPIADDRTKYAVSILAMDKPTVSQLKVIAGIKEVNFLQAKAFLQSGGLLKTGYALEIQKVLHLLTDNDISFKSIPDFPWDF